MNAIGRWRELVGFLVGAALALFVARELGLLPAYVLWEIGKFLNWISPAITAIATTFIGLFTWTLWQSTDKLWKETRTSAQAAERQANVMIAVESPIPLIVGFKFAQYSQIPGETVIADTVPPGPIPPNCRVLFCIENKGRTPLRLIDLCIEKFAGNALPSQPTYTHILPWPGVLEKEKGPIWIRVGDDQYDAITAADIAAASIAYQGVGAFWVYGYFSYRDLLNERVRAQILGEMGSDSRPRWRKQTRIQLTKKSDQHLTMLIFQ